MSTRTLGRLVAGLLLGLTIIHCGSDTDDGEPLGKSWSAPVQIGSQASTTQIYNLSLATAPNGDTVAVWVQQSGQLSAAVFTSGGGWQAAASIGTTNNQDATNYTTIPDVAIDSNGNAIAAWTDRPMTGSSPNSGVWVNRLVAGSGWGQPTKIWTSSDRSKNASQAQVAVNASGAAVVMWTHARDAYASRFQPGSNWTSAQIVSPSTGYNLLHAVAIDDNGNATTVASGRNGSLWANRFSAGRWGEATSLVSGVGYAWAPDVAMDSSGNSLAVWMESPSGSPPFNLRASRFTAAGGWTTPESVERSNDDAVLPWMAMSSTGKAVVVWEQGSFSKSVYANRFDPQTGWSTPEEITAGSLGTLPVVSMDAQGNAMAVWVRGGVWSSYLSSGGRWSAPDQLAASSVEGTPYVRLDANGNAIAVWCQGPNVFASRFE